MAGEFHFVSANEECILKKMYIELNVQIMPVRDGTNIFICWNEGEGEWHISYTVTTANFILNLGWQSHKTDLDLAIQYKTIVKQNKFRLFSDQLTMKFNT